jgi:hypothetical protein
MLVPVDRLFSEGVPSQAHLAHLAYVHYKHLYAAHVAPLFSTHATPPSATASSPTSPSTADTKYFMVVHPHTKVVTQQIPITPINPLGFLSHNRFTLSGLCVCLIVVSLQFVCCVSPAPQLVSRWRVGSWLLIGVDSGGGERVEVEQAVPLVLRQHQPRVQHLPHGAGQRRQRRRRRTLAHVEAGLQLVRALPCPALFCPHPALTRSLCYAVVCSHIQYGDSKLRFQVKACSASYNGDRMPHRPSSALTGGAGAGAGAGGASEEGVSYETVGECVLPLNQLRWKQHFHIWLPLDAPSGVAGAAPGSVSAAGGVVPALLKPNYGRLRLKIQWIASPVTSLSTRHSTAQHSTAQRSTAGKTELSFSGGVWGWVGWIGLVVG